MSPKIDDSRIQHFGGKVLQSGLPNLAGTVLIKTETRAGELLTERLAVRRLTDFMTGSYIFDTTVSGISDLSYRCGPRKSAFRFHITHLR